MRKLYTLLFIFSLCLAAFSQAPNLTDLSPADNATDVSVSSDFTLTFDTNVQFNTTETLRYIYIYENGNPTPVKSYQIAYGFLLGSSEITISSNIATINPTDDLNEGTDYYIIVENGAIESTEAIPYTGLSLNTDWNFTTYISLAPPAVTDLSPADGTTDVSIDSDFVITFDINVQFNSTSTSHYIYLYEDGNPTPIKSYQFAFGFLLGSSEVTVSNNTVTINPTEDLNEGTNYYIIVENGAIESTVATPFPGLTLNTDWNFTTYFPPAPPGLTDLSPADGITDVDVDSDFTLTFDTNVQFNSTSTSHYIYLYEDGNPTPIKSYQFAFGFLLGSGEVTYSTNAVIINPSESLNANTDYYIIVENGAIEGIDNTPYPGLSLSTDWNFTTADTYPIWADTYPKIQNISKSSLDINGQIDKNGNHYIVVTASNTTPTEAQIKAGQDHLGAAALVTDTDTAIANTEFINNIDISSLDSETDYWVHIVVEDGSNNFTTAQTLPFTTTQTAWADTYPNIQNITKTTLDVYGQVDDNGNHYIVVTASSTTPTEAQIKAGQDHLGAAALVTDTDITIANTEFINNIDISSLDSETNYWVHIVVEDGSSNFTTAQTLPFTTQDTQTPSYNTDFPKTTYINGTSATLGVQINENGLFYWVLLDKTETAPSIAQVIAGTDAADNPVSNSGSVALASDITGQTNVNDLTSETDYTFYVVTRDNNTNYIETTVPTDIDFTTTDITPPQSVFDPVDLATDVIVGKTITIDFNEPIYNTLGDPIDNGNVSTITRLNENSAVGPLVPTSITYDDVSYTITIDPTSNLKELQLYNIRLEVIQDASENITTLVNSTFTTEDITPPVTSFDDPTDGQLNYSIGAPLMVSFDEEVRNLDGSSITEADLQTLISFDPSVTFTASINANADEVVIYPDPYLTANTTYKFKFDKVEDIYGNEQLDADSIEFTTAQFNTWNGSVDNDFSNSSNWEPGYAAGASSIIPAGTPEVVIGTNSSFPNMVIESLGKVTINSGVSVSVTEELTLKSDNTGNGSLIIEGSLSVSGSNIKVEQNISDPGGYNFVSSPVESATMNNIEGDGLIYSWNSTNGTWDAVSNSTTLSSATGYILSSSNDLLFQGALNNASSYNVTVNRTSKNSGWTLVGNPYTAAFDWENLTTGDTTDVEDGFWIWLVSDQYGTWNGATNVGTNVEANSLIPSNHAFWVKAKGNAGETLAGSLTLRKSYLTHNTNSYMKSGSSSSGVANIRLTGIHNGVRDEKVVAFFADASENFERFDSEKRFGSNTDAIELYSIIDTKKVTINTLPELQETQTIPLGIKTQKSGTYQIQLTEIVNFDNAPQVLLTDNNTEQTIDLSDEDYYEFSSDAVNTTDRFTLEIIPSLTTNVNAKSIKDNIKVYSVNDNIYIRISDLSDPRYEIYDISGKLVKTGILNKNSVNSIRLNLKGPYIAKVVSAEITTAKKLILY
jgi:hypothetical protein